MPSFFYSGIPFIIFTRARVLLCELEHQKSLAPNLHLTVWYGVDPTAVHPVRKFLVIHGKQAVALMKDLQEGQALLEGIRHRLHFIFFIPLAGPVTGVSLSFQKRGSVALKKLLKKFWDPERDLVFKFWKKTELPLCIFLREAVPKMDFDHRF